MHREKIKGFLILFLLIALKLTFPQRKRTSFLQYVPHATFSASNHTPLWHQILPNTPTLVGLNMMTLILFTNLGVDWTWWGTGCLMRLQSDGGWLRGHSKSFFNSLCGTLLRTIRVTEAILSSPPLSSPPFQVDFPQDSIRVDWILMWQKDIPRVSVPGMATCSFVT